MVVMIEATFRYASPCANCLFAIPLPSKTEAFVDVPKVVDKHDKPTETLLDKLHRERACGVATYKAMWHIHST